MKYLICSIGSTAAGKTTTLRKIADRFHIEFISEGLIKRNMIGESFNVKNSMDENLRNRGYKNAIDLAFEILKDNDKVIIDASFHQLFRRLWVYESAIENHYEDLVVIWIYCYCNYLPEVENRIKLRADSPIINADNQARSMEVYYYTNNSFDNVNVMDFPVDFKSVVVYNNTFNNRIDKICCNSDLNDDFINEVVRGVYG